MVRLVAYFLFANHSDESTKLKKVQKFHRYMNYISDVIKLSHMLNSDLNYILVQHSGCPPNLP